MWENRTTMCCLSTFVNSMGGIWTHIARFATIIFVRRQFVLLGTVHPKSEFALPVYAKCLTETEKQAAISLKAKLALLLDKQFRPAEISKSRLPSSLMHVDEVLVLWACHRITVLRLIKRGQLHPIEVDDEMFFERSEVVGLANRKIAAFPHLTVAKHSR